MAEQYDYSRHKYCIILDFDYDIITSDIMAINGNGSEKAERNRTDYAMKCMESKLFDTHTNRGKLCENSKWSKNVYYVPNVFSQIKTIYSNDWPKSDMYSVGDNNFFQKAINILQEIQRRYKQVKICSDMDFYYAIVIPTNWEYETREEFIRPFFVIAGLIHGNDSQGRLIFFSKIEPIFQRMQESSNILRDVKMKLGDQYVLCTIDYQDIFCVNLELVSAQYPDFTVSESKWVPQLLKQIQFTISSEARELRLSLEAYLERHCSATLSPEIIDAMFVEVSRLFEDPMYKQDLPNISGCTPFKELQILSDNKCGLKEKEINSLQSITQYDIYKNMSGFADKIFNNQMDILLEGTSNLKSRFMIIFSTDRIKNCCYSRTIPELIRRWSKTYCKQKKSYKLIANGRAFKHTTFTSSGILNLLTYQIQVFNIRRAPVILSNNTAIEQSESYLKPTVFINIDMSPTQTKAIVTYLDKSRQDKQTRTFDCNIKPLDSFITYSKLYQKPMLCIENRLKVLLENIFGDYLKLFAISKKRNTARRTLWRPVSKLLDRVSRKMPKSLLSNCYRIKLSENRLKEIKNILFKKFTENHDLFTPNDEFCSTDNDLFTTCHPAYIFFFTITYLYNLNKMLEEKLETVVGINWQNNNIWYGVSIDKGLLDTAFGSIKKLEKSFFACGILRKDNNLRRAKFCTRGEEILPAIQRKLMDLEFKIKSYFVVAQVFSKHIQLTLHQVVILASSEKDAASFIVQDEILHIDDVYDNLCKTLWRNIQTNCRVSYCSKHKGICNVQYDFESFQAYSDIHQNLQLCVVKHLENNKTSVDMNSQIQLNINSKCTCSISILLRDIIEVALMTVIENITSIITASLTNKRLFGNYVANYIFVSGDPFNLSYGSKIHTTYTMLLQKAIDDAVQFKKKDTMTFVLEESLYQLLQLVAHTKLYMFETFITGKLCRVSSETYALRIKENDLGYYHPFIVINRDGDIKSTIKGDGSYLVFIQKGKPVSTKSFIIQHEMCLSSPCLDVIQLDSSKNAVSKKYSVLDGNAAGTTYKIQADFLNRKGLNKVVECEQLSYNISLNVGSLYYDDDFSLYRFLYISDPLTLAYL